MNEYEIEKLKRENEELKKKLRRKQQEADELALMGFMVCRVGQDTILMDAATEFSVGYD